MVCRGATSVTQQQLHTLLGTVQSVLGTTLAGLRRVLHGSNGQMVPEPVNGAVFAHGRQVSPRSVKVCFVLSGTTARSKTIRPRRRSSPRRPSWVVYAVQPWSATCPQYSASRKAGSVQFYFWRVLWALLVGVGNRILERALRGRLCAQMRGSEMINPCQPPSSKCW